MRIRIDQAAHAVALSAGFVLMMLAGAVVSALVFADGFARLVAR